MYQQQYQSKSISVCKAVSMIKSNNHVVLGSGPSEPWLFIENMATVAKSLKNVTVSALLSMKPHEIMMNPKYSEHFKFESGFYSSVQRITDHLGMGSHMPTHLGNCAHAILSQSPHPDIYVVTVSPMDEHGYFSTGPTAVYEYEMVQQAKTVIFEVSHRFPRTFGDTVFHINDVDFLYEVDRSPLGSPVAPITKEDKMIGQHIATLVEDGSTIQLGIGNIPNAVAWALIDRKDLGIYTEMLSDAMVDLVRAGAVTGKNKTFYPGKVVTSFSMGSKKVYEFINNNPNVLHFRSSYINNPMNVAKNDNMVSINTTLMVDFTGQCASESIQTEQISGTGGQVETVVGSQMAMHGKSIIALRSTAFIDVAGKVAKKRVSNIVPYFEKGTIVTLMRTDVDYIVTEYGIAKLKGLTVNERVRQLIEIAHPKFRKSLTKAAIEQHLI